MLKNTCYEGQICKYDTSLEASAQGLLIEAYQHTQTKPNQCSISTFLTSQDCQVLVDWMEGYYCIGGDDQIGGDDRSYSRNVVRHYPRNICDKQFACWNSLHTH